MKGPIPHLRRRWWVAAAVLGAIVLVVSAMGIAAAPDDSATAGELASARAASAAGPGFAGTPQTAAGPAGDDAPPIAEAPLAGAPLAGLPQGMATRPVYALADHPLFAQHVGLERVDCRLPEWQDDVASTRAFGLAAIGCLNAAWEPTLRGAGLPFRSPRLVSLDDDESLSSPCEPMHAEAFYCSNDETITLPVQALRDASGRGARLAVLSHEYGHHVQSLVGVMRAYRDERESVGWNTAAGQEQNRRLDLQARCFSGMFFGTSFGRGDIDKSTWDAAANSNRRSADEHLQGSDDCVWGWWKWGSDTGDTWECNTWYAAAPNVS